jgi:hypothetical protein
LSPEEPYPKQSRLSILISSHRTHWKRSTILIGLFVIYLPIVYQMHLDIIAAHVIDDFYAPGLWWATSGYTLFPIPFDAKWIGSGVFMMFTPLSPLDIWAYHNFVPNIPLRMIWSLMWLTIGLVYIIWPMLGRHERYARPVINQEKSTSS